MTLVHNDDLPEGMKERQNVAHDIAEQACEQTWNIAVDLIEKNGKEITGNELLSYMGTILMDFSGRWISLMDRIRQEDQAGVLREDLIKDTINGILATISCTGSFEEEPELPNGIKKLKRNYPTSDC